LSAAPKKVRAGRITSPHGLDGSVKIAEPIPALLAKGATVEIDGRLIVIERRSGTDARPIIRLAGCSDRNAAELLRGAILMVERDAVPELGADEWWTDELVGCRVTDGDEVVGEVAGVLGLPSCEALQVARPDGSVLLVPLIGDAVRTVDTDSSVIDVDLIFLGEA